MWEAEDPIDHGKRTGKHAHDACTAIDAVPCAYLTSTD